MDPKAIETDIKNYKVREGPLYKRSKFLKEWRERWIVLTTNYMYTFANKSLEEVTDTIDLKEIKSYKSYLRKDEEMIPPGFKIRSVDEEFYFCAKNCNEKWSWLVTLERLMDYKYIGTSNYNNSDWIKTKGFDSQLEFESGGKSVQGQGQIPQGLQVQEKNSEQSKKDVDAEAEKIMKQLQEQQKELERKTEELNKKEAELEQKRILEEKAKREAPQPVQQPVQQPPQQPTQPKQEAPKPQESPKKTEEIGNSKVAQLRSMYESKMTDPKDNLPKYDTTKYQAQKVERKEDDLHIHRAKAVSSLFEEFRKEAAFTFGLRYITDFLVNVCGDEKLGYAPFVIVEGKSNHNRKNFSEVFIELLSVYNEYDKCENLMRFIEICIFQIPGLFNPTQTLSIQRKLKEIFNHVNDDAKLSLIIKNMFIINKLQKYERSEIIQKLDRLVKETKNEETRNWARKLHDEL